MAGPFLRASTPLADGDTLVGGLACCCPTQYRASPFQFTQECQRLTDNVRLDLIIQAVREKLRHSPRPDGVMLGEIGPYDVQRASDPVVGQERDQRLSHGGCSQPAQRVMQVVGVLGFRLYYGRLKP